MLRAGLAHLGELERTDVVSDGGACSDPAAVPTTVLQHDGPARASVKAADFVAGRCSRCLQTCGVAPPPPRRARACENLQGVTVDYVAGNSTITTIENHPQTQRSNGHLEELLAQSGRQLTHGAFMHPHADVYFDAQCEKERNGTMPDASSVGDRVERCDAYADADCPRGHPTFGVLTRHVPAEQLATVLRPDPTVGWQHLRRTIGTAAIGTRCVTDAQVASPACANRRNTTVWMTQALQILERSSRRPVLAKGSHQCVVTCSRKSLRSCQQGPGVAATWLVLRAVGLAAEPRSRSRQT